MGSTVSTLKPFWARGRTAWLAAPSFLIAVLVTLIMVSYLQVRPYLLPATASWVELIAIGVLLVSLAVSGLVAVGFGTGAAIAAARKCETARLRPRLLRLRDALSCALTCALVLAVLVLASQWMAHTPPILTDAGEPLPNSIASLEKVQLGKVDQWLIVRGQNVDNPVLLFLSGGPGGSEAGRVLRFNQELEKHFVVAIWEQRGCGKSYPAIHPKPALTVEQYAADIVELAEMLRARFDETKIYLVGHSWGTIIGVRAIQERPDLFYAYVGAAQMVNALEADRIIYDLVEEHARETGDTQFLQVLKAQGPPPYGGKNPVGPYARIFTREYQAFEMSANKSEAFRREGDLLMLALRQPEYGWVDRINYLRGLMDTFNVVYPQLQTFDFRRDAPRLELPIYLVLGRHDTNAPSWLSEDYFNLVQAPSKELVFFEDSGHGMIWQEPSKFHDLMVHSVLPATYQP